MGLLWKSPNPTLPDNRVSAVARLKHLRERLQRDPELLMKYRKVMDDYLAKGYAVKLTDEEAKKSGPKTWYLPHHPVSNPNKPGKIRVVFDAAAKFSDTSLNDNLLQGPCLTNDLAGVLIRFREEQSAFTADVEAMFYQVLVSEEDTEALRFLWWSGSLDDPPEEYRMTVHIFGAKDSLTCAIYALMRTAQDNSSNFSAETIRSVMKNFYVDDLLKSTRSVKEARELAQQLSELLKLGGFRLTKWISNSREVLESIPLAERANKESVNLDNNREQRALGIRWEVNADSFSFKFERQNVPMTKRGILKVISSVFDPLGFVTPFVLKGKVIIQELWRRKYEWDDIVAEDDK